jgi:hypothetical protein
MRLAKQCNKATLCASGVAISFLMLTDDACGKQGLPSNGVIAYPCRSANGHQNICLISSDGTGKVQITFEGDNGLPTWSPTGKQLAYTNFQMDPTTQNLVAQIVVMSIDDLSPKFISPGVWPAWSPDGKEIAFTKPSASDPSTAEIWAMRPDGTKQRQLTDAPGFQKIGATWSPDGKFIAYTRSEPAPGRPPPGVHNSVWVTRVTGSVGGKDTHELTTGFICPGPTLCFHNLDADGDVIDN